MREQPTQREWCGRWWSVVWPRAPRNCSLGSRAISVLGAPFALLLGVLLAVGLMLTLPLIATVFVVSDRLLGGPQLKSEDVAAR